MKTLKQVFKIWPSLPELARDLGIPYVNVFRWKERNSIPADKWLDVIAAAKRRGKSLDLETLYRVNMVRPSARKPASKSRRAAA